MSWKSVRPEFAVRLALSMGALGFLALALGLIHKSATAPWNAVSLLNGIIVCNVIAAALLIGSIAFRHSGVPTSALKQVAWFVLFVLLLAAQLALDAYVYLLFGGRIHM